MPSRILLVDDHQITRSGLAQLIAEYDDLTVAAEASDGDEAIRLIRQTAFDVVILDISMPGKNGIDVMRITKQIKPEMNILVLSGHPGTQYAINVFRSGANGYLGKDAAPAEIIKAIRMVARGRRYLSEETAGLALLNPTDKKLHETLSEREFQIFLKLADGQGLTAIADALNLSVKTVSTHRARVMLKMNLQSNAELTYYAIKNALI